MQALAVPQPLQRYVRAMRVAQAATPDTHYQRLPDGESELMVSFGDGPTRCSLIGTRTRVLTKPTHLGAQALLVRFRLAGAHPFFGRPLSALTDEVVSLEDLWTEPEGQQLSAAQRQEQVEKAVVSALLARLNRAYEPAATRSVRRALQQIAQSQVLPRVPELAASVGVSERQLRRGFDQVVGLSPKHYLRVVRFRRALRLARSGQPDWAAIAEASGYFDQAHLIAEFREMAGVTPAALVSQSL